MESMSFELRFGNVSFTVGEYPHPGPTGKLYKLPFRDPATGLRRFESSTSVEGIKEKAALRAKLIAKGVSEAATIVAADIEQFVYARRLARERGLALNNAIDDWAAAFDLAGADLREAARRWRDTRPTVTRIKVAAAVDAFIAARTRKDADPERTYRSKLSTLAGRLGDIYVDEIDYRRAVAAVIASPDPGTQNDLAKRLGTMLRWCRKMGHLPPDRTIVTELIDRNPPARSEIEVINADTMTAVLKLIRDKHPHYLGGLVLAAFVGLRSDEVHGKRSRKGQPRSEMVRQRWSDVHIAKSAAGAPHVVVTVAKKRTPSDRHAILTPNAIEWLKCCDRDGEYVMAAGGMERVREISAAAGIELPDNAFRHTCISAGLVHLLKRDKAGAAENYGTSVQIIDRHYRRPLSTGVAKAWFSIRP